MYTYAYLFIHIALLSGLNKVSEFLAVGKLLPDKQTNKRTNKWQLRQQQRRQQTKANKSQGHFSEFNSIK